MKQQHPYTITLLGSMGGVAKSILSILNYSVIDEKDPIHSTIKNSKLYLIDVKQGNLDYYEQLCPNLTNNISLLQLNVNDVNKLMDHLRSTNTQLMIDVSNANTIAMLQCCNELGIRYINTALENNEVYTDKTLHGFSLTTEYQQLKEFRDTITNTKAILFSGMNPGIVQWMAINLLNNHSDKQPLACYIVEHDTSFYKDQQLIQPNTIYTTWSVKGFLDETILAYPLFVRNHLPHYIYDDVYATEYKVTLGDKEFCGYLVPHEEVLTLGEIYDFEVGFIYRINEYTTQIIQNNSENANELLKWNQKIIDPADGEVVGEDLIGVLLVFDDKEVYMYNSMNNSEIFEKYKTNGTYFQVGCGVYAGLASLLLDNLPLGAHYVDELVANSQSNYGKYLSYYMKDFVYGENQSSDGLLHNRMKKLVYC
ncbi:MAG: S-adenosylmethionine decarboxylase related protein [Lysinibacillus sp.]|nr:S-adenosylmethionine decarboxylase related protein [Lysinibacillus sp.]